MSAIFGKYVVVEWRAADLSIWTKGINYSNIRFGILIEVIMIKSKNIKDEPKNVLKTIHWI